MAHLGTYTIGGIQYDRHTGRAISGTDTVDTEFVEEFNGTYVEINLDPYDQVSDKDGGGFFDASANMYMNANGEMILTHGRTNESVVNGKNQNRYENDGALSYYDFSKPNQENGDSFTDIGRNFYAGRGDYDALVRSGDINPTEKNFQTWQRETLTQVENEIKSATNAHFDKVKKSNPNQIKPGVLISKAELEKEANKEANKARAEAKKEILENYMGLHNTDRFLQRLSLKNLKYPIDADYGNTQDYIQINQFTYKATSPQILFPEGGKDKVFQQFGETITSGLTMKSQKEKFIGLTKLPMPMT